VREMFIDALRKVGLPECELWDDPDIGNMNLAVRCGKQRGGP
jgi:hypothetical protein